MSEQTYRILCLPGDGVGPEITNEATQVLDVVAGRRGFTIEYEHAHFGGVGIDAHGVPIRDEDIELAQSCDAILMGAIGGPKWDGVPHEIRPETGLLKLRSALGLFANLRPIKVFDSLVDASPLKPERVRGTDFVFVRELTGGIYFGRPSELRENGDGRSALDTLPYSEQEISRLVELGFQMAMRRRKKVTSVDKSNVLATSRLWRTITNEVAERYPEVELEHALVDSCAMRIISRPQEFDVIVIENMFGDILSDEGSVLAGSLGMPPSASLNGQKPSRPGSIAVQFGLYEPIHGSAPHHAGRGTANPSGAILSAAMLLNLSFGLTEEANAIEAAVDAAIADGVRTPDIAGGIAPVTTTEFGAAIRERLDRMLSS